MYLPNRKGEKPVEEGGMNKFCCMSPFSFHGKLFFLGDRLSSFFGSVATTKTFMLTIQFFLDDFTSYHCSLSGVGVSRQK